MRDSLFIKSFRTPGLQIDNYNFVHKKASHISENVSNLKFGMNLKTQSCINRIWRKSKVSLYQVFNYPYDTSLNHPNPGVHDNEDKPAFFKMAQDFVAIHPWMAKHPTW